MEIEPDEFSTEPAASAGGSPLELVEGELKRPKISAGYRFSLVAVALAMVLLPLIYLGIVGVFGWSVVWYATHEYTIMSWETHSVYGTLALILLYLAPVVAGGILIFFLIKPIFAPRGDEAESFSLNHADAPRLFALIGWICRSLNAPIPSRIDVNVLPNASAGFRAGWRSIFGNDIVLTIGLPLVAGMNLSQFAGVIAHEYGHFSQGLAMRAMYVITRINGWFYRVVYQRDAWDVWLATESESPDVDARARLVLHLARAGVWFGRGILWALMMLGILLSAFLSRQMEYDADRYEINLCGSAGFIATMQRLQQLSLGTQMAAQQLAAKWKKEKRLYDQLAEFVVSRADEIPAEIQGRHYASANARRTGWFDSHPSDAERVRHAQAADEPGVFHATAAATTLFADFGGLSRKLTRFHYENMIRPGFSPECLVSVEQRARLASHDGAADEERVRGYLRGVATPLRPLIIAESQALAVRSIETLVAEIRAQRARMEELLPAAQAALARLGEADERQLRAGQAGQLLLAGYVFEPADFGLADSDAEGAQNEAAKEMAAADGGLRPFGEAAKARLAGALQILRLPVTGMAKPGGTQRMEEAREMVWVLARLGEICGPLLELRRDCAALEILLHFRREQASAENLAFTLEEVCTGMQERVNGLQEATARMRYPFDHTTEQIFVNEYARNKEYHPDPAEQMLREGKSHVEKLFALYQRVLGRLVELAEEVEREAKV